MSASSPLPRRPRSARKASLAAATGLALAALLTPPATAQPTAAQPATTQPAAGHAAGARAVGVQAEPLTPGKPYYLLASSKENRGVTFEPYADRDYALLTNTANTNGTAVVFEKQDDGYVIRSTRSNWSGHHVWCATGSGIRLDKEGGCATHWQLFPTYAGYLLKAATGDAYLSNPAGRGKQWLRTVSSALPGSRELTAFKPIAAE
ncbi:hypothetical protein SSP35_06_01100 [Streptomyces sp. NBRC 110611]|uniref:hypothetical protein n=1 Tax=Streptomyces sp. NBRC 110611 TaxID=1621259 RepID=UPI0008355DA4|nr:hypothetical protein [Streptomyces sp. NBRC 110611]GAU68026.1 hypothetical protein SSP35_06_01100 [Streptomyces sp. NBRC 110611]